MNHLLFTMPLIGLATLAAAEGPFTDHGVGAKVAECRGVVTTRTADGRNLVIANSLDLGPTGWLLVTDIDSGQSAQHFYPSEVPQSAPYGSLMSGNGRFYTAQGPVLTEFDPATAQFTYTGRPALTSCYLSFTQDLDGTIWAGGCGAIHLVSFNPTTRETKDHGVMDPGEQYLSYLATDDKGWVYCGIGTARQNIVAYDPKTGEKRQLVDEAQRALGTATVYPTADGKACGIFGGKTLRLYDGAAEEVDKAQIAARRQDGSIYWGQSTGSWPDGRSVKYDLPGKFMVITEAQGGKTTRLEFDYQTEGAAITSLGSGPEGIVYASSCHPMHLLRLDTFSRELADLGPVPRVGGGNYCAIVSQRGKVFGAQYSHGALWEYDPARPWNPNAPKRQDLAIKAQELMATGQITDGHFTYLSDLDVVLLRGDKFGAVATFRIAAPEDGTYYLQVLPLKSARYCKVAFSLDGKSLGEPLDAAGPETTPGPMLSHGPVELAAGEHTLTAELLPTEGQEPWASLCSVELSREPRQAPAMVETNPRVLAEWKEDICRPRTALAHPDGRHVLMAGFAGYGRCGGGVGIYDLDTGEAQLLTAEEDLLPSHSTVTLQALPNGDLVGGTSISAPGGGHVAATEAELWLMDFPARKVTFHTVPVPGDREITSIIVGPDGLVYGLSGNATFFVFDPESRQVMHSERLSQYGGTPRHAWHIGPDGKLYVLLSKAILRVNPGTFEHEKLADTPVPVQAGGALVGGLLCFANGSHVWTYDVPGL